MRKWLLWREVALNWMYLISFDWENLHLWVWRVWRVHWHHRHETARPYKLQTGLNDSNNILLKYLIYTSIISYTMAHPYCNELWVIKSVNPPPRANVQKTHLRACVDWINCGFGHPSVLWLSKQSPLSYTLTFNCCCKTAVTFVYKRH